MSPSLHNGCQPARQPGLQPRINLIEYFLVYGLEHARCLLCNIKTRTLAVCALLCQR